MPHNLWSAGSLLPLSPSQLAGDNSGRVSALRKGFIVSVREASFADKSGSKLPHSKDRQAL
jgi:hypothetical protein